MSPVKSMRISLLIFFVISGSACGESKQRPVPISSEQTEFSAEHASVKRPVAIPDDVRALLSREEAVRTQLENEHLRAEDLPPSWFLTSEIHLTKATKPDLIVVGKPPINGANVALFWIFRATVNGHELILFTGAHDLRVVRRRWKGFREIEVLSVTQGQVNTILFRFDGQRYARYKATSEKIQ